jgi:alpha-L-rhamnosidase
VKILSDMAEVLGRNSDVKFYKNLSEDIKKKFNSEYYDPETGDYSNGTQTANLLPLFLDMVPEKERGKVYQNLNWSILYENNTHLTTGIVGTKYLMEVLPKFNNSFLAYDLAVQTTYPSWGYMIQNGATTLWELWQNKTGPLMNSHNHPMFGCIGSWFYKILVGINMAEGSVGFEKIRIEPNVIRDLEYVAGSIQTIRGPVECSWSRIDKGLLLDVTIPVNSEAEIIMPKLNLKDISLMESSLLLFSEGRFKTGMAGITMVDETRSSINIKVGSGRYSFKLMGN